MLDEWDELLQQQFRRPMARLAEHVGASLGAARQAVLVSATYRPAALERAALEWRLGPAPLALVSARAEMEEEAVLDLDAQQANASGAQEISTMPAQTSALPASLAHFATGTAPRHAADALRRAVHALGAQRALVFLNAQGRLRDVEAKLRARRMPAASLHAGLAPAERQRVLEGFRAGRFRALLVTDLAARGLDVPDCDLVVHADLPDSPHHYAHRAGRTARLETGGGTGFLVVSRDVGILL